LARKPRHDAAVNGNRGERGVPIKGWTDATVLMALMLAAAGQPAAAASLKDENLLVVMPEGFKVGFPVSKGPMDMAEYVPSDETVDDWSRMVTIQIFHNPTDADPNDFAGSLGGAWAEACPGGSGEKLSTGTENGFPVALWSYACPLNPAIGKPESMWLKVTGGTDALYSVQYAYRQSATDTLAEPALSYLKSVLVCDTRRDDRACPKGM
jgi:hypothetical protein